MGVISGRALFGALILAAGWVTLLRPRGEVGALPSDAREIRMRRLTAELYQARFRWTALEARDSARSWVARSESPGTLPAVMLRGFPTGASAPQVDATIPTLWGHLGTPSPSVRTGVLLYNARGYRERGWYELYSGSFITQRDGTTYCVAIAPGETRPNGKIAVGRELLESVLSPCLLLTEFGPPGAGIGPWLDATRYSAARSAQWLLRPKEFLDGGGGAPWDGWYGWYGYAPEEEGGFSIRQFAGSFDVLVPLPPYRYGSAGVRCLAGDAAECGRATVGAGELLTQDTDFPRDLTLRPGRAGTPKVDIGTVRPLADWFVSDLIREHGRERFGAFWRSGEPLEGAFQSAFGEDVGSWTARWARRQWAASWEGRQSGTVVLTGVSIAPSWPILVAAWSALILVGAGWAANRRQSR